MTDQYLRTYVYELSRREGGRAGGSRGMLDVSETRKKTSQLGRIFQVPSIFTTVEIAFQLPRGPN